MDITGRHTGLAVQVTEAKLTYGHGAKAFCALRGVDLRVPEGVIYGLLGPSGCGKTTLLCTVVGRRRLHHGEVKVFGTTPGAKDALVPGKWVGFMPQEMSLYPEFTIEETLMYFGRLHRIDSETLKERSDFLLKFLDLPRKNRMICNLSGGQQRRVSFAAALIHSPPLLILDEPTVGVDPLLRRSIWNHLRKLATDEGMTVVITTHYIEEARQANVVGLMREGRLLAEGSPDTLIQRFGVQTLEDCFLKLCQIDKNRGSCDSCNELGSVSADGERLTTMLDSRDNFSSFSSDLDENTHRSFANSTVDLYANNQNEKRIRRRLAREKMLSSHKSRPGVDCLTKTYALTAKNMTRLRRNLPLVLFQFALPTIQVILLCLCIGRPPFNLPMAIVNHEGTAGIGNLYIQKLSNHTISKRFFPDIDSAIQSVVDGATWGALEVGPNFTSCLLHRYTTGVSADNDTINGSTINVYMDMTNQQIGMTLQTTLLESFQDFAEDVLVMFGADPLLVQLPVVFRTPIFGSSHPRFTEFIAPGVILSITYIMAVGLTSLSFVEERKSGLLERSWVSGVTTTQILISHMITQSVVLVVQVSSLLIFTFLVFDIPSRGPFIQVILLTLLQGATGMSYGLLISALVTQEATAIMIALGSFYPNLIISGIVWPVQGMPKALRMLSYCLPQTLATEAMRATLSRGWNITYTIVYSGFLVSLAWLAMFLIAAGAIFRLRR